MAAISLVTAVVAADQRPAVSPGTTTAPAELRAAAEHVLNRVAYGARPGDIDRVLALGPAAYIEAQLNPDRIADSAVEARLARFTTLGMSTPDLVRQYFQPAAAARRQAQAAREPRTVLAELAQARMLRAVYSERQLQEVLVDFWLNHFNVFAGKGQVRVYLTEYERDVIRPHVLGSFRELLGAVAHSPAMLFYLDNWQSAAPGPPASSRPGLPQRAQQRRRGINENYARELMELHTIGVDGGYTQNDVVELARILTGWTIDRPRAGGSFIFRPGMHDPGTKTLLGATFAPTGAAEGEYALDLLARHPATARHIAFKLAQRFVADEPPAALVARAAAVFTARDGNLREVVRSILTSQEFMAPASYRAKVKTPLEFVVSAVRATGATVTNAQPLVTALRALAMPLYGCQPPSGYSMTADAWVNSGALLNRMNFATVLVAGGRMPRANLVATVLPGGVSDTTARTLARAGTAQELLALTLGSPEFQRR